MKITLKTLQGKQLPMEVEADVTIENLKKQIEEQHQMPAETQQLVAYGKVLQEAEKTLGEYNIKDGDFLVVMVRKAKPVAAKKPDPPKVEEPKAEVPASTTAPATSAPVTEAAATNPPVSNAPATTAQQQPAAQNAPQQLTAEQEETVEMLISISGKPRPVCIQALQAAFGDPDRAFQYLDQGIPAQAPQNVGGAQAAFQPGNQAESYGPEDDLSYEEGSADAGSGMEALQQIAQNPNFQQLRQRMMQNPAFYTEFMQTLQTQQPELAAAIQQNPQMFMNLILGGNMGQPGGMPGAGAAQAQPQPQGHQISVTQEELAAIERLEQLGFHKQRCLQAYLACDKNEELAANFLFEQGADDDEDALAQGIANSSGNVPATTQATNAAQPTQVAQPEAAANTEAQDKPEEEQPAAENNANDQPNNQNNNGDNNEGGAGAGGAEKSAFE